MDEQGKPRGSGQRLADPERGAGRRPPAPRVSRAGAGTATLVSALVAARPVLVGAVLLAVALAAVGTLDVNPTSRLLRVAVQAGLALVIAVVSMLWLGGERLRLWAADVTAAAGGVFAATVIAAALQGTPYPLGGVGLAAAFRTPAVGRFIQSWHNADFSYQGLPAFYPPLMPWLTGRAAAMWDLPPYLALKYSAILVAFVVPVAAYLLWRRLLPAPLAALVSLAAAAVPNVIQPDAWLSLFVIVPWWLDAVYGLRRPEVRRRPVWVQGIVGALIFCLYYYFFFIMAVALLLAPALDRWHPPLDPRPWLRRLATLGVAAALSSVYWLPLLVSIAAAQEPVSLQNRWFTDSHVVLPVNVADGSVLGLLMLGGLAHLVWTARRDRLSAGMLLLVVAGYVWYVTGFVLAAIGMPVLVFRTEQLLDLVLVVAGVRAAAALVALAAGRQPVRDVMRVAVVLAVTLVFVVGQGYAEGVLDSPTVAAAHNRPLPDGTLPRYAARRTGPRAPTDEVLGTIRRWYDGAGQPVVLTTRSDILQVAPLYAFNQWRAIYAHPAGEFSARLAFTRQLAAESDPQRFAALARNNRFDSIDAFVLEVGPERLRYAVWDDNYPYGNRRVRLRFEREQFDPRVWHTTEVGGYFIAVRR